MRKLTSVVLALSLCASYGWGQDGTLKWAFQLSGTSGRTSPAIGSDGTVYAISVDGLLDQGTLHAINPEGTEKWVFPFGTWWGQVSSPSIAPDGTIFFGTDQYIFHAVNPDGTPKWQTVLASGDITNTAAVGKDGRIYLAVSGGNGEFYALNPRNGVPEWRLWTRNIEASPAMASDGTVYFTSSFTFHPLLDGDRGLFAVDSDGTVKWAFPFSTEYNSEVSSPAIGEDGTVYVGAVDKNVYAVNPDGTLKWAFVAGGSVFGSPTIGPDGTIYVGAFDSRLYAINPDGTLKWKRYVDDTLDHAPTVGEDGTIYVGLNFDLHAFRPDGTQKWRFPGRFGDSNPAISEDGTLYVLDQTEFLYAINTSSNGLADSSWPMFNHDPRHRGRVDGPGPDCTLDLDVSYAQPTLNLNAKLGNTEPVTWNGWLIQGGQLNPMWSSPLDVIDPPGFLNREIPDFPQIGPVIIVTAMKAGEHYICSDTALVDTGAPTAAPSTQELQDLFRGLAP